MCSCAANNGVTRATMGRLYDRAMDAAAAGSLLELAERASPMITGPDGKAALAELDERNADLLAAMQWFVEGVHMDEAFRLANALYRFWITTQRFEEGAVWFGIVLGSPGGDDRLRGRACLNGGFMPFWMGDDEAAAELFGRSLDIGRQLDDQALVSQALGGLARVALRTDVAEGRRLAREALAVSEAAGDAPGRSNAIHLLGVGAQIAGDLLEARGWMTQRLALVRATDNQVLIASEACNLSMVERQLGDLEAAEALAREALEIEEHTGDQFPMPFAFSGLAAIASARGQVEHAATLVGAAEAIMAVKAMAWPPDERPHYEVLLAALPEAMGSAAFERAREAGRSMATSDAVALALSSPEAS
jgi:tetratricopeptide (TPR) repeat protein